MLHVPCIKYIVSTKYHSQLFMESIVRPVKRDWAVLSKDSPVDISM